MQPHEMEQALQGMDTATASKLPEPPHDSIVIFDCNSIVVDKKYDTHETFVIYNGKILNTNKPEAMPVGADASLKFFGLDSQKFSGRYAQERMFEMRKLLSAMTKIPLDASPDTIHQATGGANLPTGPVNSWVRLAVFLAGQRPGALQGRALVRVVSGPTRKARTPKPDGTFSTYCDRDYYPASSANG